MSGLICMIGASGFLGARTMQRACSSDRPRLRALVHRRALRSSFPVETVEGDAADTAAVERLLEPGALVLNFAYGGEGENERIARSVGQACARRGIRRLVHVSTCSVYGASEGKVIDERSACIPVTAYERGKLAAEEIALLEAGDRYELVILQPTAVFGPGGRNLESLARRVLDKSWPRRYLRACAMGRRRMHVVDVECVAAAAIFLGSAPLASAAERFIVSQDDEPGNDYLSIEAFFVQHLGAAPYPLPVVPTPSTMLRLALRLGGRSDVEPQRRYSSARLAGRGFVAPRTFDAALSEYAAWIAQHARP